MAYVGWVIGLFVGPYIVHHLIEKLMALILVSNEIGPNRAGQSDVARSSDKTVALMVIVFLVLWFTYLYTLIFDGGDYVKIWELSG